MKKFYTLSLLFVAGLSFAQFAEPFAGTGALSGTNGWTTHSGTASQLQIITGSLNYTGLNSTGNKITLVAGNSEDVNKASAAALTGSVYYSAVINLPNTTGLAVNTGNGDYFMSLGSTAGAAVNTLPCRLYIKLGSVADTFNLGILNSTGGTVTPSYISTDYTPGTPLFVVIKYDMPNNIASLYVNPAIGSSEGTPTITNATGTTAAPAQILSLTVRQGGNATSGTGNIEIDEIRLGSTWASVTSADVASTRKFDGISGLKMYPNPLIGNVLTITSDSGADKTIAVYDVLGKQVLNTKVVDGTVNVASLTSGVYIVKITEEGKTATRKLVVR
ncbi:hypothetical protein CHU92_07365 [Flavobacterium cyanobacteriorum]|uniref:Secretion system C-terminal sorting domain-containing protein n=1 Tax=Flavobacterium cyanobacteriorum TaxID=2022802 RepID=A0A255Z8U5_9FLAO|nr:T9SS type A sorting domain-containing protein [Flavobacterium cyanobacteriorum]OYQ37869.1 hypothetical protein CHU92_07365 [Flavobacterium cyanobacteriorum]